MTRERPAPVMLDAASKTALRELGNHLSARAGKDMKALGRRLLATVNKGQAKSGDFTMADLNLIQHTIKTAEFSAEVLADLGALEGAAKDRALADRLKKYQDVVARLGVVPL